MYAQLCRKLSESVPDYHSNTNNSNPSSPTTPPSSTRISQTFKTILLAKCKDEFENRKRATEAFDEGKLSEEDEERRSIAKQKMLGNIKFICELGKQELLHESILHVCIQQLFKKKIDESIQNKAEDIECLCQIMKTNGRLLDTEKGNNLMNQYFDRVKRFLRTDNIPPRIRFMLQDVIELRQNKWVPRPVQREQNPTTIVQIREQAAKDLGVHQSPFPPLFGHGHPSHLALFDQLRLYGHLNPALAGPMRLPFFNNHQHPQQPHPIIGGNHFSQRLLDEIYSTPFPSYGPANIFGPAAPMPNNGLNNLNINDIRNPHNQNNRRINNPGHPTLSGFPSLPNQDNRRDNYLSQQQQQLQRGIQQQQQQQITGNRELPPRFQRQNVQPMHQQQPHLPQQNSPLLNRPSQVSTPPMLAMQNEMMNYKSNKMLTGKIEEISLRPPDNSMIKAANLSFNKQNIIASGVSTNVKNENQHPLYINKSLPVNKVTRASVIGSNSSLVSGDHQGIISTKGNVTQSNKETILKKTEEGLLDYLSNKAELNEIIQRMQDLKIPKNFQCDALTVVIKKSLDKNENERELANKLLIQLKNDNVIAANLFVAAFKNILCQLTELEPDIPRVKSHVAGLIGGAISGDIITLKEAFELDESGKNYPLFLLILQHLNSSGGQSWLLEKFNDSKIQLMNSLPEIDRKKDRLADLLKDRGLSFLYPLLKIESELWQQINNNSDCTPNLLYRWIRDNVDNNLYQTNGFINILFTIIIKHVIEKAKQEASEATFNESKTPTNGANMVHDFEKDLLAKYAGLLSKFTHENGHLQLIALYSLQTYWYDIGFPKGMLKRWFEYLYDMDIIDENIFFKWKEEINDEYPGKGKALFDVNKWLDWIKEEEEDEEYEISDDLTAK